MDFAEAVEHYYLQKKSGNMSLGDIRSELKTRHDFRDEHVQEICRQISDRELAELEGGDNKNYLQFLNHKGFSILMVLVNIAIIIYSFYFLSEIKKAGSDAGYQQHHYILPYVFIGGAFAIMIKHLMKIRKSGKQ